MIVRHVPNLLTGARIALVPVLLSLLAVERYASALGVGAVAALTDALDGHLARRWHLESRLGAMLDPLADKLLIVGSVLVLASLGRFPPWLALAVVGRDGVILAGALAYRAVTGSLEIRPTFLSKANTAVQLVTVLLVVLHGAGAPLEPWLPAAFGATLATTVVSGAHYVVAWTLRARSARAA